MNLAVFLTVISISLEMNGYYLTRKIAENIENNKDMIELKTSTRIIKDR